MLDYNATPGRFAVALVLQHEGGLVDDPEDPGGLTNHGISIRAYPALGRDGIKRLTPEDAASIYARDYWARIHGDELRDSVAVCVMDAAVNCGVSRAVEWLREVVGLAGSDGITEATIKAAASDGVAEDFSARRLAHYCDIITRRPPLVRFRRGWFRRTALTLAEATRYEERNA